MRPENTPCAAAPPSHATVTANSVTGSRRPGPLSVQDDKGFSLVSGKRREHTLFVQEMARRGVHCGMGFKASLANNEEDIQQTTEAAAEVSAAIIAMAKRRHGALVAFQRNTALDA